MLFSSSVVLKKHLTLVVVMLCFLTQLEAHASAQHMLAGCAQSLVHKYFSA